MPKMRDPMQATQKATGIGPTNFDPVQAAIEQSGGLKTGSAPLPMDLSGIAKAIQSLLGGEEGGMSAQALQQMSQQAGKMGKQAIGSLRGAGYKVPATGFRSTADIDQMMANPPTADPPYWDQFLKYTNKMK